jgi:hypothetical protein
LIHLTASDYDDSSLWGIIEKHVLSYFPLLKVSWNSYTIERLQVDFVPITSPRVRTVVLPIEWFRKPFVHVYLLKCEDPDVYKSTARGQIKAWLDPLLEKQQEAIIVYIPQAASSSRFDTASKAYRKIYEKLRGDFKLPERLRFPMFPHVIVGS